MRLSPKVKKYIEQFSKILTEEKDRRRPLLPLSELGILIAAMVAIMFYDPFRMTGKITDLLRLYFPLCTREPRLLYYASVYFGTFIFKVLMLAFIALLLVLDRIEAGLRRVYIDSGNGALVCASSLAAA